MARKKPTAKRTTRARRTLASAKTNPPATGAAPRRPKLPAGALPSLDDLKSSVSRLAAAVRAVPVVAAVRAVPAGVRAAAREYVRPAATKRGPAQRKGRPRGSK